MSETVKLFFEDLGLGGVGAVGCSPLPCGSEESGSWDSGGACCRSRSAVVKFFDELGFDMIPVGGVVGDGVDGK